MAFMRRYLERERLARAKFELEIEEDRRALKIIRETIMTGGEKGRRMAYNVINTVATELLTPKFGITDYKLITGKENLSLDGLDEFRKVLIGEAKTFCGLNLPYAAQEFIDINTREAFMSKWEEGEALQATGRIPPSLSEVAYKYL